MNDTKWFCVVMLYRTRENSFSLSSVIVTESQREKRVKHNDMMIISKYEREW